jgi:uncharacterized repeat protein (TIGR02543 family)
MIMRRSVNILNKLMLLILIGVGIIVGGIGITYVVFLQPKVYTVTLSKFGYGEVAFYPEGGYLLAKQVTSGTKITIKATPDPGFDFIGWTGDYVGSQDQVDITVDRNMKITAVFVPR